MKTFDMKHFNLIRSTTCVFLIICVPLVVFGCSKEEAVKTEAKPEATMPAEVKTEKLAPPAPSPLPQPVSAPTPAKNVSKPEKVVKPTTPQASAVPAPAPVDVSPKPAVTAPPTAQKAAVQEKDEMDTLMGDLKKKVKERYGE